MSTPGRTARTKPRQNFTDLKPHAEALFARIYWGASYAESRLGTMGFWGTLEGSSKRLARECVKEILEAAEKNGRDPEGR